MKRFLAVFLFLLLASPARADAPTHWNINPSFSTLTFAGKQMGTDFKGTFEKYTADINFDPARLQDSSVKIDVDTGSFSSGDKDRDTAALTRDWFDAGAFPVARFAAASFKKTGNNAYVADGTLTIKGITVPVQLPFTLEITQDAPKILKAHAKGSVTLDRSKFSLGGGQWADTSVIANEVPVTVHITAIDQGMGHF